MQAENSNSRRTSICFATGALLVMLMLPISTVHFSQMANCLAATFRRFRTRLSRRA